MLSDRSRTNSGTESRAASEAPKMTASGSSTSATTASRDCFQNRFATNRLAAPGLDPTGMISGDRFSTALPIFGRSAGASTVTRRGAASETSHSASCVGGLEKARTSTGRPACRNLAATGATTAAIQGSSSETIRISATEGAP